MIGYLEDLKNKLTARLAEAISAAGFAVASGAAGSAAGVGAASEDGVAGLGDSLPGSDVTAKADLRPPTVHGTASPASKADLRPPTVPPGTADAGVQSATGKKPCADWVQVRLVPVEKWDAHGVFTTNAPLLIQHRQPSFEGSSATAYGARHRQPSFEGSSATAYGASHREAHTSKADPQPRTVASHREAHTSKADPQPRTVASHRQLDPEGLSATDIARALMERFSLDALPVERVTFAAPGFLNFYLVDGWQQKALERILRQSEQVVRESTGGVGAVQAKSANAADSEKHVDFEIWYAYHRICNQLELLDDFGYPIPCVDDAHLELLRAPQELRLMEHLAAAPSERECRASEQASARQYLSQLAFLFHQFFNISRIRGETREIAAARICLLQGSRLVFESVLKESFL